MLTMKEDVAEALEAKEIMVVEAAKEAAPLGYGPGRMSLPLLLALHKTR